MDKKRAMEILAGATRLECRDHAFGDREVSWTTLEGPIGDDTVIPPETIAGDGYFGGGTAYVTVYEPGAYAKTFNGEELEDSESYDAEGREARELAKLGGNVSIGRNDSTGPDNYVEDRVMPGLTLEGVRAELTGGK
jgi:hypothetical protein